MKKEMKMYRQGDVLLVRVERGQRTHVWEQFQKQDLKSVILAYGETTGHAHVLDAKKVEAYARKNLAWDAAAERFIKVIETTALQHLDLPNGSKPTGEHADITLEPGTYQVIRQREWDESMRSRYVSD